MTTSKEVIEVAGIVLIRKVLPYLPLGNVAMEIYDEVQKRQVERKIKRLELFYESLAESLNMVKDEIERDYVEKSDFLDIFEEATKFVISERIADKRVLFKNILVNSITSPDCDYDITERYFRLLDNMGKQELSVLAVLCDPIQYDKTHGEVLISKSSWNNSSGVGILTLLLGLKVHQVEESLMVLFSNGLIKENATGSLQVGGNTVHVLKNLLTVRGRVFVRYLGGEGFPN